MEGDVSVLLYRSTHTPQLVAQAVRTKTVEQCRSHAQKYFAKLKKLGLGHLVPPTVKETVPIASVAAPPLTHHSAPGGCDAGSEHQCSIDL